MKKILAFCDYQTCYGSEGILTGLYENPDVDVYEVPIIQHVRGRIDQGYDLPGETKKGFTSPPGYFTNPLPENRHTPEDVLDNAKNFDLIILLSYRDYAIRGLRWFLQQTGQTPESLPLVLCDGEDAASINNRVVEAFSPKLYMKREMVRGEINPGHVLPFGCEVWPLPFSAFSRSYPADINDQKKETDLFLSLGNTFPGRITLLGQFLEYGIEHDLRTWVGADGDNPLWKSHPHADKLNNLLGWTEYIRKQAQSKVTACMRGWGRDTLHAWEAFSFETAVLYADPGIHIPYPPEDGKHVYFFKEDCSDLKSALDFILNADNLRRTMAKKCKQWLYEHHTNVKRAEYMINVFQRILAGEKIDPAEFGLQA